MGTVYLVEHLHTGEQLALKLLHAGAAVAENVERFKREARASARIKSESVVRVTDADVAPELDGAPFLVMELLVGEDLEQLIERAGAQPFHRVVWMLAGVARALDKAHAIGIVHRDLKPENLFLHRLDDGREIVKIVDFGISKMTGAAGAAGGVSAAKMTQTGAIFGTPYYMAPEQAKGDHARIGPSTDMWAIGLIAHRLLSGQGYWTAQTLAELMVQLLAEPLAPPSRGAPWLPPSFDAWFMRSCERDASLRWGSVTQQIAELAGALGVGEPFGLSQSASPVGALGGSAPSGTAPRSPVAAVTGTSASQPPFPHTTTGSLTRTIHGPSNRRSTMAVVAGVLGFLGIAGAVVTAAILHRAPSPQPPQPAVATMSASAPPAAILAPSGGSSSAPSAVPSPPAVVTAPPPASATPPAAQTPPPLSSATVTTGRRPASSPIDRPARPSRAEPPRTPPPASSAPSGTSPRPTGTFNPTSM
jgi:serine/threonine-protein kinase